MTIASAPPDNHLFQVQNFNALEKIRETLQEKIFSIEGTVLMRPHPSVQASAPSQNVYARPFLQDLKRVDNC